MKRLTLAALTTLLLAAPLAAGWRATQTEVTIFYRADTGRCDRALEVIDWAINGGPQEGTAQLHWAMIVSSWANGAVNDLGGGRCEISWVLDRTWAEQFVVDYLTSQGVETSGLTAAQKANQFSALFRQHLIRLETDYAEWEAAQAAPEPAPVEDLDDQ